MGNPPIAVEPRPPSVHPGPDREAVPVDVSQVPLQEGRVATRCAVRADLDHDPAVARQRLTPTAIDDVRIASTQAFMTGVLGALGVGPAAGSYPPPNAPPPTTPSGTTAPSPAPAPPPGTPTSAETPVRAVVEVIPAGDPAAAQAATVAALAGPADVVVGGRLPDDLVGRRTGGPDLLVRTRVATPGGPVPGWVPVQVRNHGLTRSVPGCTVSSSPLDQPDPAHARPVEDTAYKVGRLEEDGLQLAHHWRLLEAAGLVAPGQPPLGGLIDRSGTLWWIDLGEPRWSTSWSPVPVSTLAHYDHAFRFRLDVIAARLARNRHQDVPRPVGPVRIGECSSCPWDAVCSAELEAADHVSLIPRSAYRHYLAHRERGVETRAAVAALHWPTAHVLHGSDPKDSPVDLAGFLATAAGRSTATPITDLAGDRYGDLVHRLLHVGIHTVAALHQLHARTASYAGADVGHLPTVIDQARAAVSGTPHRARGLERIEVRRADVEVDVDMENVDSGVYLWGTHVSGTPAVLQQAGVRPGYHPFFSWEPMDPAEQAAVFGRFWEWLTALRHRCAGAGLTFAAYCYTSAEHTKMRQIRKEAPEGAELPSIEAIDELVASADWVDLYDVVRASLVTGHGLGLKRIAPLAAFSWRDHDPGGLQSMLWHQIAVTHPDPAVRAEHRSRLLAYNEDDVLATLAVREWLDSADLAPIESWSPPPPAPS